MSEPTAVYRFYDAAGTQLYVGISAHPETRWVTHSRTQAWWPSVARIEFAWLASRPAALIAEATAIAGERPVHNVMPGQITGGGVTPNRVFRVEEPVWSAAKRMAKSEGRTLSSVLTAFLREYVSTPPEPSAH